MIIIFVAFYFLLIRPQQKKQKAHQAMVRAAKRGDKIVTSGGILGQISKANEADNDVEVEIAKDVKIRVLRTAISDIINRNPEAAKTVSKDSGKSSSKEGANDA